MKFYVVNLHKNCILIEAKVHVINVKAIIYYIIILSNILSNTTKYIRTTTGTLTGTQLLRNIIRNTTI